MTEKELREKMSGLYGGVPTDTHAAYEHALTHHREQQARPVRVSKVRFAVVLTLLLALLATGAYAVYRRYSVTDYMRNSSQAFMDHVITLDETYTNDLFTMTVNDLVFDGSNFAVAMNIDRHSEDVVYYMRTKVRATCAGEEYEVDVEGWRGPDFLAGGMWPEFDFYDSVEQEGFGFEGVLWDWDMNPPPAGEPIEWTMTFTVFRPLWEIEVDNDISHAPNFDAALEARCLEAYQHQKIFMYGGDVNSYVMIVANEMDLWDLDWEDMIVATGAFELADVITFHFTTDFDDDVVKEELSGQRFDMGEYTLVIDSVTVSVQRVHITMHLESDHIMSYEEVQAAIPDRLSVTCRNAAGETVYQTEHAGSGHGYGMMGVPEGYYGIGIDFYYTGEDIASLSFQGNGGFSFTLDLP